MLLVTVRAGLGLVVFWLFAATVAVQIEQRIIGHQLGTIGARIGAVEGNVACATQGIQMLRAERRADAERLALLLARLAAIEEIVKKQK